MGESFATKYGMHRTGIHQTLKQTLTVGQIRRTPSILQAGAAAWNLAAKDREVRWKKPAAELERIALMSAVSMVPGLGMLVGPDTIEHFVEQRHPGWKARAQSEPTAMPMRWTSAEQTRIANQFLEHVRNRAQQIAQKPRHPQQSEARRWLEGLRSKRSTLRTKLRQQVLTDLKHVTRTAHLQANPGRAAIGSRTLFQSSINPEQLKAMAQQRHVIRPVAAATGPNPAGRPSNVLPFRQRVKPAVTKKENALRPTGTG